MTDEEREADAKRLEGEFKRLFETGEVDKIIGRLRSKFRTLSREDVRDMFNEACHDVIVRQQAGKDTSKVAGLITTIAKLKLVDLVNARIYEDTDDQLEKLPLGGGWQHDEEYQDKIERAIKYVRDIVEMWDSHNHRDVMLLMLDAAADGLLLQPKEMDEQLGCKRGNSAVWKSRALDRLRSQIIADGILTWNELLELLPVDADEESEEPTFDNEEITEEYDND